MAKKSPSLKSVETIKHDADKRKNIPTAEHQSVLKQDDASLRTLRVNYRTSHQIRVQADRLLGPEAMDVDGNSEDRSDTISVFNGPLPVIRVFSTENEEVKSVGTWLAEQTKAGVLPHEFGVFVRSAKQFDRAQAAVKESGLPFKILDEHVERPPAATSPSAPCTWPRDWSSVPLW